MSTENVRRAFLRGATTPDAPISTSLAVERAFDAWLAEERRAAAEKAYEQGRNDERHDCDRYTEHQQGQITDEQLKRDLRNPNPYRTKETKA